MAKTYRLRSDATEALKEKRIKMILETKDDVRESDVLGAVIWKYLAQITHKDVERYREEVLGKD
ncbi:MAG: hypothetical protein WC953_07385 [Pseudomonas sp.]